MNRKFALLAIALFSGLSLRAWLAQHQGLWVDEIFSRALASGHSLEHPRGSESEDFKDMPTGPVSKNAGQWRRDFLVDKGPGPLSTWRAVRLSDTNAPGYYLLLRAWNNLVGPGDLGLRWFSIFCWLAGLPLLWRLGRLFGGRLTAGRAVVLSCLFPASIYFSTEGRMYALLWLAVLGTLYFSTIRFRLAGLAAFLVLGFYTHYTFIAPAATCLGWMWLRRPDRRNNLFALSAVVLLILAPWYQGIPEDLQRWRVTMQWLQGPPDWAALLASPLTTAWQLLASQGRWCDPDFSISWLPLFLSLGGLFFWLGYGRWKSTSPLSAMVAAGLLFPALMDLARDTQLSLNPRYAVGVLPVMILLLARISIGNRRLGLATVLLAVSWIPGFVQAVDRAGRMDNPMRAAADQITPLLTPQTRVLVHSIPSGVLGMANYLPARQPVTSLVSQWGTSGWKEQLQATSGQPRLWILLHELDQPTPELAWLDAQSPRLQEGRLDSIRWILYGPSPGRSSRPSQ